MSAGDARKRLADSRDESRGNADRWAELRALADAAASSPNTILGQLESASADYRLMVEARTAVPDLLAALAEAEHERDEGFEAIALRFNALGAKLEQAEREARELREQIAALADEWEETCLGTICNSCGADNFSGASKFADSLRSALTDLPDPGEAP